MTCFIQVLKEKLSLKYDEAASRQVSPMAVLDLETMVVRLSKYEIVNGAPYAPRDTRIEWETFGANHISMNSFHLFVVSNMFKILLNRIQN